MEKKFRVKFLSLGGLSEVTKNMYVYELYEQENLNWRLKDILIVDCGIGFPNKKEYGVDYVLPDITYLLDKKEKIRAVLLTHGHEDHISGLKFYYEELGQPVIFASRLTAGFLKAKMSEVNQKPKIIEIETNRFYEAGKFTFCFIHLTHSILETSHIFIKTPIGNFYHGSDFKFDLTPPYENPPDFSSIVKAGDEKILCLLSDSLGAENEGLTFSEKVVGKTFFDQIQTTSGKFFMTTFSTNISRIRQCIEKAVELGRKVVFLGRSMKENTQIAQKLGYLPPFSSFIIKEEEIPRYPPSKLCLIVAGSQGQEDSALSKIASDQHPYVKIEKGDKVLFSADPIPGLENDVYTLVEKLAKKGAIVIYPDIHDQLHASGHGNQEDLKFLIRLTHPRFLLPIGGTFRHQVQYLQLAKELGYQEKDVLLVEEGQSIWFEYDKYFLGEKIPLRQIFVDAYGVGDVGKVVLKERENLGKEGVVVVIVVLDEKGLLKTRPRFVSFGFVFEKHKKEVFGKAEKIIAKILKPKKGKLIIVEKIKEKIKKEIEDYFFEITGRTPLIEVEIINLR